MLPLHPSGKGQSRHLARVPVLGVSRSGFHAWDRRPPSERALVDARLSERIAEIHRRSRDSYGVRRVYLDLRDEGVRVGKRVERLMRSAGLPVT